MLDDIGFTPFLDNLRAIYLNSVAKIVYSEWVGEGLDSHRGFTVFYSNEGDRQLNYHYDNAEVTLNVSLNGDFQGGDVYFCGMHSKSKESSCNIRRTEVEHKFGWGILHRGRQMHGAMSLISGERHNLIFWMRSCSVRNKMCPMCNDKPKLYAVDEGYGDGFVCSGSSMN